MYRVRTEVSASKLTMKTMIDKASEDQEIQSDLPSEKHELLDKYVVPYPGRAPQMVTS